MSQDPDPRTGAVTQWLLERDWGDKQGLDRMLPVVYEELHRLAVGYLSREAPGHTLQPTALVHEAYLRLLGPEGAGGGRQWSGRRHFFAVAAEAMRRILIDEARRRRSLKRGGGAAQVTIDNLQLAARQPATDLLALNEALDKLAAADPAAAELVKLRYFAGLSHQEAAAALGLTRRAADRVWSLARAWLYRQISKN